MTDRRAGCGAGRRGDGGCVPPLGRLVVAVAAVVLPVVCLAQAQTLQMPASFVATNFDRVFVGLSEAHEAGAYLARATGPAAAWYNPAGFATQERTAASLNVRGGDVGLLSLPGASQRAQFTAVDTLPVFAACVLGPEILPWRDVRLALSVTEQAAFGALAWWASASPGGHWSYTSDSSLTSYLVATSVAWAASPRLRLGGSLGVSMTQLYENDRMSALGTAEASSTVRSRLLSGMAFHLVPTFAVQWEVARGVEIGTMVRAPGLQLWGNATLQAERQDTSPVATQNTFIHTGHARFEYRIPLEVGAGLGIARERWAAELDLRFHASSGSYPLVSTGTPVETETTPPGGTPAESPFIPVEYRGRAVVDVALGGSFLWTKRVRLHGGAYACPSPVASGSSQFRQMDLYGVRAGLSIHGDKLSGSIGLGYETGESRASPSAEGLPGTPIDDRARLQRLSGVLAVEFLN
jgi:hypothetical protein